MNCPNCQQPMAAVVTRIGHFLFNARCNSCHLDYALTGGLSDSLRGGDAQ